MNATVRTCTCAAVLFIAAIVAAVALAARAPQEPPLDAFFAAAGTDGGEARRALDTLAASWRDGYAAMLVDLARLLPSPRRRPSPEKRFDVIDGGVARGGADPSLRVLSPGAGARQRLTSFLEKQTGLRFGDDLRAWRRWFWSMPYAPHAGYAAFKGRVYAAIDPTFRQFFPADVRATIRLDEIDWGGVKVNGIPPLRDPKVEPAAAARWLRDHHIVFGVVVNGAARAYPKRILAWHELATDTLGGVPLAVVYCTLCGTVIPYHASVNGRRFTFGTSGLLYRSNKLMFDDETKTLWSSLQGIPVVGPLAGSGLHLPFRSAVTTTWGEWKREHPQTTVVSVDTGFERDYSEGAAYREYFSTDSLMFEVPGTDDRLPNKAEVLVIRPELLPAGTPPVAVDVRLLQRQREFEFDAGGRQFVVITSPRGANRVYARDERRVEIPSHRVFWFAWRAQYPDTILYK